MITPSGQQPEGHGFDSLQCHTSTRPQEVSGEKKLLRRLQWSLRACSEWVKGRQTLPRGCIGRDHMASLLHAERCSFMVSCVATKLPGFQLGTFSPFLGQIRAFGERCPGTAGTMLLLQRSGRLEAVSLAMRLAISRAQP